MDANPVVLVIPDVHGRRFWKDAVRRYPNTDTIFLGDYHDPYPSESIPNDESLHNFIDILDYARNHNNVQLLLGNHDMHYLCDFGVAYRYDYENAAIINSLLRKNLKKMSIATTRKIADKTVLFSHAPILTDWIKAVGETKNLSLLVNRLNRLPLEIENSPWKCEDMLGHISHYRSGWESFGSPIWADMREISQNLISTADYSVFAHTQLKDAVITDKWANLDCRNAFVILSDMKIQTI